MPRRTLENGCILEDGLIFPTQMKTENGDRYEVIKRCNNKECVNEVHTVLKLTHDAGMEITYCESRTGHLEHLIKLRELADKRELLLKEYVQLGSLTALATKYNTSRKWLNKTLFGVTYNSQRSKAECRNA